MRICLFMLTTVLEDSDVAEYGCEPSDHCYSISNTVVHYIPVPLPGLFCHLFFTVLLSVSAELFRLNSFPAP